MAGDYVKAVGVRAWRLVFRVVTIVWLFYVLMMYTVWCSAHFNAGPASVFDGMILSAVGWTITCAAHEAGHAIGAIMGGWRIIDVAVRPLEMQLPSRSIAVASPKRLADARGWVFAIPATRAAFNARAYAGFVIGGPSASLLLAVVTLSACLIWTPRSPGPPTTAFLVGTLGWQALFDLVLTLLPARREESHTDGDKLRELWRDGYSPIASHALAYLGALQSYDVRLREYPQWMVDEARHFDAPPEMPPDQLYRALDTFQIGMALDSRTVDVPRARALIDRFLATYGDSHWLASCDVYLAAVWENDVDHAIARVWTGTVDETQRPLALAADAAIAARQGRITEVHVLLRVMDRALIGRTRFRDVMFDDIRRNVEALIPTPRPRNEALPKTLTR